MSWLYWGSPLVFKRMNIIKDISTITTIEPNSLVNADCIEAMKLIPDKSVQAIICDLPYEMLESRNGRAGWDKIISFDKLWEQYLRIIKDNGCIALFSSGSFTYKLLSSMPSLWRYKWLWLKNRRSNFVNSHLKPMTSFEEIQIFSKGVAANNCPNQMLYNPQGLIPKRREYDGRKGMGSICGARPSHKEKVVSEWTNYPCDTLKFNCEPLKWHPSAKSTALLEYLVRTYTNEEDVVLDNCAGSFSTGIASVRSNRKFIGIELDATYFELGCKRIEEEQNTLRLF